MEKFPNRPKIVHPQRKSQAVGVAYNEQISEQENKRLRSQTQRIEKL
jgi:hypothetical protein